MTVDTSGTEDNQYAAWGVVVQTGRVRAGHIANGLVQLLRVIHRAPPFPAASTGRVRGYIAEVVKALKAEYDVGWQLSKDARKACIGDESGPVAKRFAMDKETLELVAKVLNADGLVHVEGGNDPTTPGLSFAGYTSTHTLKGMHAATFLGLLARTDDGADALRSLHTLLRTNTDPHSALVSELGLGLAKSVPGDPGGAHAVRGLFPLPAGDDWTRLAEMAGRMAKNLLSWRASGTSKAATFMAIADLAALFSFLRLVRWRPERSAAGEPPLLLVFSPVTDSVSHLPIIARAQQNMRSALAALDQEARTKGLVIEKPSKKNKNKSTIYWPSTHAQNVGAASGWLYPLHSQGGATRYFRPRPRQLATLVHGLLVPGEDLSWNEFAARTQDLGLVIGGPREAAIARQLRLQGGAMSLRDAGLANRQHLVALGLARQESDNVVRVDGGLR